MVTELVLLFPHALHRDLRSSRRDPILAGSRRHKPGGMDNPNHSTRDRFEHLRRLHIRRGRVHLREHQAPRNHRPPHLRIHHRPGRRTHPRPLRFPLLERSWRNEGIHQHGQRRPFPGLLLNASQCRLCVQRSGDGGCRRWRGRKSQEKHTESRSPCVLAYYILLCPRLTGYRCFDSIQCSKAAGCSEE